MVTIDPEVVQKTESYPVAGILRIWGDVGDNGKDELVREF